MRKHLCIGTYTEQYTFKLFIFITPNRDELIVEYYEHLSATFANVAIVEDEILCVIKDDGV